MRFRVVALYVVVAVLSAMGCSVALGVVLGVVLPHDIGWKIALPILVSCGIMVSYCCTGCAVVYCLASSHHKRVHPISWQENVGEK